MAYDANGFCRTCQRHRDDGCQCDAATAEADRRADRETPAGQAGKPARRQAPPAEQDSVSRRLVLTPASEIKPRPVLWGWQDRMPAGHMTLIPGREGIGKSLFLVWLTARLTRGELPGCYQGRARSVIYSATEDSWQHTIAPRLIAAGADLSRVFRADVEYVQAATGESTAIELTLPRDGDLLAPEIKRRDVAMIALDPLMSVISSGIDTHNDRELRTALEPLGRLADETGVMIVGLAHFNKSADGDPLNLVTGSRAFTAFVRSVVAIARDPDSENGQCIISQVKNNMGPLDLPNLTYVVQGATIQTDEGDCTTGRLLFTGESARGVRDILGDTATAEERGERAECAAWIRERLAGGPVLSKELEADALAQGYSRSTYKRARKDLGTKVDQIATGTMGKTEWWVTAIDPKPLPP